MNWKQAILIFLSAPIYMVLTLLIGVAFFGPEIYAVYIILTKIVVAAWCMICLIMGLIALYYRLEY